MGATRTTPGAATARDAISTGEAFVAALADRDFEKLEACFHPQVRFRALVPPGLRERNGSADAAAQLKAWFSEPDHMQLLQKEVYPVSERVHISYRFREQYSDGETEVIEQHAFCDAREGLIESMDLVCSGFLPEPTGDAAAQPVRHRYDSGDLGCGSGLPQEFRRQVSAIPVGHVLEVVARDPSAKEDLPSLARLLGHEVLSVGTAADGSVVIVVKRGR
jgi:TusA-related sulfurtransferase